MQNNNFSNAHSSGYDDDDGSVRSSGVDEFLMFAGISFSEFDFHTVKNGGKSFSFSSAHKSICLMLGFPLISMLR